MSVLVVYKYYVSVVNEQLLCAGALPDGDARLDEA